MVFTMKYVSKVFSVLLSNLYPLLIYRKEKHLVFMALAHKHCFSFRILKHGHYLFTLFRKIRSFRVDVDNESRISNTASVAFSYILRRNIRIN